MQAEVVTIGIFVFAQTCVAIFWAGKHTERSFAHGTRLDSVERKAETSREAIRDEVRSALEAWQEGRGEKISGLADDVEKLTQRIDRGFDELRGLVTSVSNEMSSQHHRLRTVERQAGIQPSEPRFPAVPHPRDPRRDP